LGLVIFGKTFHIRLIEQHIVNDLQTPVRLYDYAKGVFVSLPTGSGLKKAIKRGCLKVNSQVAEAGTWLQMGDVIEVFDAELKPPKPYHLKLQIIYDDEDMSVVVKPAGITVSGNQFRTLQNALLYNLIRSSKDDALGWPRPVHRLDSSTSGLVMIAKTTSSHIALGRMFENRSISKVYHAVVMGNPPDIGTIDTEIDGHAALTRFEKITTVHSLKSGYLSLLRLMPETGRTHQLRIHCASSGFPILGDQLYGPPGQVLLKKGLFLYATGLSFIHPLTNTPMNITIDIPRKFFVRLDNESRRSEKYDHPVN
jgi:23S rRNA pseudouridine1911/1915/1917 synthase